MDSPMAEPTSGVNNGSLSPLPSSTATPAKPGLSQDDLTFLNAKLNNRTCWPQRLLEASDSRHEMTMLLETVLMYLTDALAHTSAKGDFLSPLTPEGAESIVRDFSADERRAWECVVRVCIQHSDWMALIAHPRLEKKASAHFSMHEMFGRAYQGDFHKLFVRALDDYENIYDPFRHSGRIIPIIQSSGTGKSRMVKEIGNDVPTLSISLRKRAPGRGWPPCDEPARAFLMGERPQDREYKGEELAAAFLAAVMTVVAEKIEARGVSVPQQGEWMYDWRLDLDTPAEKLLLDNGAAMVATRVSYSTNIGEVDSAEVWHRRLFDRLCRPSFEKLSQILTKRDAKRFILAFDDCSELNSYRRTSGGVSLVELQRILKAYDGFVHQAPVWFLFVDTDPSLVDMDPVPTTNRFLPRCRTLPAWPYVGFNQMAEKDVFAPAVKEKLPTYVHSMKHLKLYGRPFWSTLKDEEVLNAALKMLLPFKVFRRTDDDLDDVFAIFAARVGLEIGVGQASERLATEAVRHRMRILDAVVDSNVMTTSPPEPMLALAAAMAMNHSPDTLNIIMETLLDKFILKGVVLDRGLLGALPSRLLLLCARDRARANGPIEINPITKLPTVQPVRLSEFLQTLLGKTLDVPNEQGKDCDRLLWEADYVWINFTHFCHLPRAIGEVTESMLVNAWSTGAAFQCARDQPVIDGFIVGYRGSLDKPFQSSCLVTIPWKLKTKSDAAEPGLAQSLTAPFIVPQNGASAGSRYKPWHVVILIDLAASSFASRKAEGPGCDLTCEAAVRPEGGGREEVWKSYAEVGESEGQRYCLAVRRCACLEQPRKQFDILFRRTLGCAEPELVGCAEKMEEAKGRVLFD